MKLYYPVLIILLTATSLFSADPDNFSHYVTIKNSLENNKIYKIPLSSSIIEKSYGLKDIRLFNESQEEVPFIILDNKTPQKRINIYEMKITSYDKQVEYVEIIAQLPEKYEAVGSISFDIAQKDFQKNIVVYAQDEKSEWKVLSKGMIYDFSSRVDLRNTSINIGESNYRNYKIRIYNSRKEDQTGKEIYLKYDNVNVNIRDRILSEIKIDKIYGKSYSQKEEEVVYDSKSFIPIETKLDEKKRTIIDLNANLPADKISFEVESPYYFRKVQFYYKSFPSDKSFHYIKQGSIYRFLLSEKKEEKNIVTLFATYHPIYRFIIENHQNPPLKLKKITYHWVEKQLFFIALNDSNGYKLVFGNRNINAPHYDIGNFIRQDNWHKQKIEGVKLSPIQKNVNFVPTSIEKKEEREKTILTGVIILMVVGLGFWLYRLMRKMAQKEN